MSAGVPTVWSDVLRYAETNTIDFSRLREIIVGGSAVPASLIQNFKERHGVTITQAWGMTETSPLGAMAVPPHGSRPEDELKYRSKTGRPLAGISLRIVDEEGKEGNGPRPASHQRRGLPASVTPHDQPAGP